MLGVIIIIYENNYFIWEKYLRWEIFSTYFRSKKHLGVKTISMRVKIIYLDMLIGMSFTKILVMIFVNYFISPNAYN